MGQTLRNLFKRKPKRLKYSAKRPAEFGMDIGAIVNIVSDGIAIIDNRGIVKLLNEAASDMLGWPQTDAIDLDYRSVFQLFDITERPIGDDQNPIMAAMNSATSAKLGNVFLKTASSKYAQVSLHATPVTHAIAEKKSSFIDMMSKPIGSSGQAPGQKSAKGSSVIVTFHDISNQQSENHQQSDFISTASHEMRTPVAVIEGYLGMILNPNTATVDERAKGYASKAHEAAEHLGHLFQDLLDITKIDDNRLHTNPILVDAGAAAKQAVERLHKQAADKGLELSFVNSGEVQPLYIIYIDLDHLEEILDNIIGNAIKYTKAGWIKVSVSESEGKARISVQDTGIGIPSEDVSHLFQKFYRVDSSDTREIGGTGLGLYLIRRLTEEMGGKVGVESDYGHGSHFWVEFDRLSRDQAVARAHEIRARKTKGL